MPKLQKNGSSLLHELRTCKKCGWVHFGISLADAKRAVKSFNDYYKSLSKKDQYEFYGLKKASLKHDYMTCDSCGGSHKNFRQFKPGDSPDGCTMGPIVVNKLK